MLRELNLNEMEMVSGGFGDQSQSLPDTLRDWERDWAERDPLVRSQILGGAGYGGDIEFGGTGEYVGHNGIASGIELELGTGDITVTCCSIGFLGINIELDSFTLTIPNEPGPSIEPFNVPTDGPSIGGLSGGDSLTGGH